MRRKINDNKCRIGRIFPSNPNMNNFRRYFIGYRKLFKNALTQPEHWLKEALCGLKECSIRDFWLIWIKIYRRFRKKRLNINPMARTCRKLTILVKIWPKLAKNCPNVIFLGISGHDMEVLSHSVVLFENFTPYTLLKWSVWSKTRKWGVATEVHLISNFSSFGQDLQIYSFWVDLWSIWLLNHPLNLFNTYPRLHRKDFR